MENVSFFLLLFQEFCETGTAPPALILLLSRLCLDFQESTISYVVRAKPRSHDLNGVVVEWGVGTQRKPIGSWGEDDNELEFVWTALIRALN